MRDKPKTQLWPLAGDVLLVTVDDGSGYGATVTLTASTHKPIASPGDALEALKDALCNASKQLQGVKA